MNSPPHSLVCSRCCCQTDAFRHIEELAHRDTTVGHQRQHMESPIVSIREGTVLFYPQVLVFSFFFSYTKVFFAFWKELSRLFLHFYFFCVMEALAPTLPAPHSVNKGRIPPHLPTAHCSRHLRT